jgi:hypothetical protein
MSTHVERCTGESPKTKNYLRQASFCLRFHDGYLDVGVFKRPNEPDAESDPLSRYLERTAKRGTRLERLERLLRQLNLQTASTLDSIERPSKKSDKN